MDFKGMIEQKYREIINGYLMEIKMSRFYTKVKN